MLLLSFALSLALIGQAAGAILYNTITMCRGACGFSGTCTPTSGAKYECVCKDPSLVHTGTTCERCPVLCVGGDCDVAQDGRVFCVCPPGSVLINGQCVNPRQECERSCTNGFCQLFNGLWRCMCPPGYTLVNGVCLDQRRECERNCFNGYCIQQNGRWVCNCPFGYELIRGNCVDIDECSRGPNCRNGRCINMPGTFRCVCDNGYRPAPDSKSCIKITLPPTSCVCDGGYCVPSGSGYQCECPHGYMLSGTSRCVDINECNTGFNCWNGRCVNLPGTFRCECDNGYRPEYDGKSCVQITYPPTSCVCDGGFCVPTGNGFQCECPYGYMLLGTSHCVDIDECLADPCRGGQCENYVGGHVCRSCLLDHMLSPDGKTCLRFVARNRWPIFRLPWWIFCLIDDK